MATKYYEYPCLTCRKMGMRNAQRAFCSFICRFQYFITKTEFCWIWRGNFSTDGYGKINYKGKTKRAHRLAYELFKEKFDEKLQILHNCHNPKCVNPEHLRVGTNDENMADMVKSGRSRRGSAVNTSKLTPEDVFKIRKMGQNSTQQSIANLFDVSQVAIGLILRNKNWKHI